MLIELFNNCKPYLVPLAVSCAVHIGIASYGGFLCFSSVTSPEIQIKGGKSVMELTLIASKPSKASMASKKTRTSHSEPACEPHENIIEKKKSEPVNDNLDPTMSSGIKRIETKTLSSDKIVAIKSDKKSTNPKKEIFEKLVTDSPIKNQTKDKPLPNDRKERPAETNQVNQPVNSVNSQLIEADMREKGVSCECKALSQLIIKYPKVSRRKNEQGTVELKLKIDENGNVVKIAIISSSGYKRIDRSAVKSVKTAKFSPAKKNGKNVASEINMNITFKLDEYDE